MNFRKSFIITALVLFTFVSATVCPAQKTFSVTGTVVDNSRNPLPSATISMDGKMSRSNITTNSNGHFAIEGVTGEDYKLVVSCVGFHERIYLIKNPVGDVELDSILLDENIIGLDEAVVTSRAARITRDRRILYPTDMQKKNSADGISLLGMMKLPKTTIIPGTDEVRYWGKGALRYYINEVKATAGQIRALLPKDIVRIEYIDRPGLEYQDQEDVGLVIKVVTKNGIRGINNSIVMDKYLNRSAGDIDISSRVTGKRSELAVGYKGYGNFSRHHFNTEMTDETFCLPSGILNRSEETIGMTSYERSHDISLAYFRTLHDRDHFYIKAEVKLDKEPDNCAHSIMYNSGLRNDILNKTSETSARSNTLITSMLYRKVISRKQLLQFDAACYTMNSDFHRHYIEKPYGGTASFDIVSDIRSRLYGSSFSGLYINKLSDKWSFQTSVGSSVYFAESRYGGHYDGKSELTRSISALRNSMSYNREKLDMSLNIVMSLNHTRAGDEYKSTKIEPKFSFQAKYLFNERSYISGTAGFMPTRPEAADLSTARQQIDEYQIRSGNPELKSGYAVGIDLDGNIGWGIFDINPYVSYEHSDNNIQEETFLAGSMIMRMPENFKYVNALKSGVEVSVEPTDWITLVVASGYNRFSSRSRQTGLRYHYGKMWLRTNINARWNRWMLSCNMWTHNNDFYGQVLETSGRSMSFSLQRIWLDGHLSTSLRIQNPFSRSYSRQGVVNYSSVAPYSNWTRMDYSFRMITLGVSYKFGVGRKASNKSAEIDIMPQNYIISSRKSAEVKQQY